jgi:LysR family transcriptional regulator (chromosome initiation inhibitor)
VREHLAAGRLVELVPGAALERPLFWQVNRLAGDRLSELTRNVVAAAKQALA